MSEILLPYGNSFKKYISNPESEFTVIEPEFHAPCPAPDQMVREALMNPISASIMKCNNINDTVGIALNDDTRPVPLDILIPPLLEELLSAGFEKNRIKIFIACGTHLPLGKEKYYKYLPEQVVYDYSISSHNCDDNLNLTYLGRTSRDTPVWVNSSFNQCNLKIVIGDIEPHHFAGFSGGYKTAAIGMAGRVTINANHAMISSENAIIGSYQSNPLRLDIDEIGKLMKIDLAINAILNQDGKIVSVLFGNPENVYFQGVPISLRNSNKKIPIKYDLVIASPGGFPKDINFYQAQKALTHASLICKKHGIIILVAECNEGTGSSSYETFMENVHTPQQILEKFSKLGFEIGPHKALQVAKILLNHKILILSEMDPDLVKNLLLLPIQSIEEGINLAISIFGKDISIAVLPHATQLIPA